MLVRDTSNNVYHIIECVTRVKRGRTYHALCGKTFAQIPHGTECADYYTRCPECKAIMLERVGRPVVKRLKDKSESSELQIGKSGELA